VAPSLVPGATVWDHSEVTSQRTQAFIVDGFRAVLDEAGAELLFTAPLVEPEGAWFPDAWSPDIDGVRRLLRRLMAHAGMAGVPATVVPFVFEADGDDGEDGEGRGERHVIAYFEGIEDGVCRFGVNCTAIDDPEYLIGILAHEIAHAYRTMHGLVVDDRDEEEELTDLTTILLGFGIFTTNNALRSARDSYELSVRRAGYLTAHVMAFAFGVWLAGRGRAVERRCAELWLEPVQRSMFAKTVRHLRQEHVLGDLGASLGGAARGPADLEPEGALGADAEPIDFGAKRGETFRVRVRPALGLALAGAVSGAFAMGVLEPSRMRVIAGMLAGLVAGWAVGRLLQRDECARIECDRTIPAVAARCPSCGAVIRGELRDRTEIHDALEARRRGRVAARREREGPAPRESTQSSRRES
jgi:hypothetical protein